MTHVDPPNLGNIITSSKIRKGIYGTYGIAVLILGGAQVAFASVAAWGGQPDWLTAALNVAAYLSIPVSALALANTPQAPAA